MELEGLTIKGRVVTLTIGDDVIFAMTVEQLKFIAKFGEPDFLMFGNDVIIAVGSPAKILAKLREWVE